MLPSFAPSVTSTKVINLLNWLKQIVRHSLTGKFLSRIEIKVADEYFVLDFDFKVLSRTSQEEIQCSKQSLINSLVEHIQVNHATSSKSGEQDFVFRHEFSSNGTCRISLNEDVDVENVG